MVRSRRAAVRIGVGALMLWLAIAGVAAPQLITSGNSPISPAVVGNSSDPGTSVAVPDPDDQSRTDLSGNDVSAAVATYQLDADGSLYEAHSPQTQLPKLGSPKS